MQFEAISFCPDTSCLSEETDTRLSGSCEEQQGLPWASFSTGETAPAPSATPHETSAPDSLPAFLSCSGLAPVPQWGAQKWKQELRCGLSSAKYRRTFSALVLLVTLFLSQARMPLAFFLASWACTSSWLAICQPAPAGPFPPDRFPTTHPPACSASWDCCDPSAGLSLLYNWTSYNLLWLIYPAFQIPLQGLPTLQQMDTPTNLDVVCELA